MLHLPITICCERKSLSSARASSALYKRLTAPSGARITMGSVPIWKIVPLIFAARNTTNPATHSGRRHSERRSHSRCASFCR